MTSSRSTRSTRRTPLAVPRSRALMLSTASVAGGVALIAGGYAQAAEPTRAAAPSTTSAVSTSSMSTTSTSTAGPVQVEHEVGTVLEGSADAGIPVAVTLYENNLHGSSIQVVLGDPDADDIGYVEQEGAFVHDGVLDVTVDVQGTPVRLHGTVTPSGRPARLVDPMQDNGEQIVVKGTNTALATDVDVTVRGTSAPVQFAPAFSFDLESRTVTLYGR
ncbi:hypothetical protein [Nocardioides marmoribigeumensis]|uniref:Uncharacterized protein n=1 Tax=Nocardioides marmoribigeumensis TaxID=433649 RepID=A0ABU2C0X6_9ACTN|nr:hypothetical protein [Nocardioides marmoribigeumensis]MDR7364327.1 hypothetical protein [Nocardioides marmoribigeumensis]